MLSIFHLGILKRATLFWQRISKHRIWVNFKYLLMLVIRRKMKLWWELLLHLAQLYHTLKQISIHQRTVAQCNSTRTKPWIWQIMFHELAPLMVLHHLKLSIFLLQRVDKWELKLNRRWLGKTSTIRTLAKKEPIHLLTWLVTNKSNANLEVARSTTWLLRRTLGPLIISSFYSTMMQVAV